MRRLAFLVPILLVGIGGAAGAEEPVDRENPRNRRFEPPFVRFVTARPRTSVNGIGDRSAWPAGAEVEWAASVEASPVEKTLEGGGVVRFLPSLSWHLDARVREPRRDRPDLFRDVDPRFGVKDDRVPWLVDGVTSHRVSVKVEADTCVVATDALKVLLLVEAKTLAQGDRRFGSFVRRFRKSLDDLNGLFAASKHPLAPDGIVDRFRIDDVVVYERKDGLPALFHDHPEFDVAIACDEGGPAAGFSLPSYSIGHNFTGPAEHHGLWSSWGEQALWHELLHFRGVQDFYLSEVADGALPGRWRGKLALPKRYAQDLMASPYQPPVLGEYTAVMANLRKGVARVGACEDTDNLKFGHVWNWLPPRIDLVVTKDGRPAPGARVRWWRSRPIGPKGAAGVPEKAEPDGRADADEGGKASILRDYLGRALPRAERGLWLLVEVEIGGETRFEIVYGLDLNLAYARGDKYGTTIPFAFERLLVPNGTLPAGR